MVSAYMIASFVLAVVMALVYQRVGRAVASRPVSEAARLPRDSFAWWWYLLGIITAGGAVGTLVSALGWWTLDLYVVFVEVVLVAIVCALAAVAYYFAYLLTGRHGVWRPIVAAYAAYAVTLLYYIQFAHPVALVQDQYGTELEYARDLTGTWYAALLGLLLLVPVLLGAVGYFAMFFRARDRSQRFRIATLAGAFVFWFGSSLVASYVLDVAGTHAWRLISNVIALAASYVVYIGYRPPSWMQRRFRLHGYSTMPAQEAK